MNSNLAIRLATAAVAVPLLLLLLYKGPVWALFPVGMLATLIGVWELLGMTHARDRFGRVAGTCMTACVAAAVYFFGHDARVLLTVMAIVPLAGPILTLAHVGDMETAALRAAAMGFAPLYVGLPLTFLAIMRRDVGGNAGAGFVVLALMLAWFSDTGGYFAGRFLGKHKLYEAVSPKKTWEGAAGGMVGALVGALTAHFWYLPSLPLLDAILLALIAGVLGQAGDLAESLFKRSTGVKDSGHIVPGHGGILDRVDALLVTATFTYLYTVWLR